MFSHVRDLSRSTRAGFCLSSYMELVIPVVAMLMGLGLRVPADLSLTPEPGVLEAPDMADPGRALAVLFSREMPRQGNGVSGGEAALSKNTREGEIEKSTHFVFLFSPEQKSLSV